MSQPARSKMVLADPCPIDGASTRIVVGGGGELRLYEWQVRRLSLQSISGDICLFFYPRHVL